MLFLTYRQFYYSSSKNVNSAFHLWNCKSDLSFKEAHEEYMCFTWRKAFQKIIGQPKVP